MEYEIINLNWTKRRKDYSEKKIVNKINFFDFKLEHYHICKLEVFFEKEKEPVYLNGQVLFNNIKKYWTINGINSEGYQVAIKLLNQ